MGLGWKRLEQRGDRLGVLGVLGVITRAVVGRGGVTREHASSSAAAPSATPLQAMHGA